MRTGGHSGRSHHTDTARRDAVCAHSPESSSLGRPAASQSRLMPRIMTMNGDHHSVAAAPLDLRTTHRERGTPDCKERVRDARPTGGAPAASVRTRADGLETNGVSSPGAASGASRKRPADTSSLPLRKRPIPVELECQSRSPAPTPSAERVSPAAEANCALREGFAGQAADVVRVSPASVTQRRDEEAGQSLVAGYPIRYLWDYGKWQRIEVFSFVFVFL